MIYLAYIVMAASVGMALVAATAEWLSPELDCRAPGAPVIRSYAASSLLPLLHNVYSGSLLNLLADVAPGAVKYHKDAILAYDTRLVAHGVAGEVDWPALAAAYPGAYIQGHLIVCDFFVEQSALR